MRSVSNICYDLERHFSEIDLSTKPKKEQIFLCDIVECLVALEKDMNYKTKWLRKHEKRLNQIDSTIKKLRKRMKQKKRKQK